MKTTLTALLAICLCLPLMGDDAAKKKFEEMKAKAEKGDAKAQYNLGGMYYKGEGVKKDDKQAFRFYLKAALQGDPAAQARLGTCYRLGEGVKQNADSSVRWYRKAAEQGLTRAQYNLGVTYVQGDGVEKDFKEAV